MFILLDWYSNGNLKSVNYYLDEDFRTLSYKYGPASTNYHRNGNIIWKQWRLNGRLHRDEGTGPQYVEFNDDGSKLIEEYHVDDVPNRKTGPAKIFWNRDGSVRGEHYYINGMPCPKNDFSKIYGNLIKCKTCKANYIEEHDDKTVQKDTC